MIKITDKDFYPHGDFMKFNDIFTNVLFHNSETDYYVKISQSNWLHRYLLAYYCSKVGFYSTRCVAADAEVVNIYTTKLFCRYSLFILNNTSKCISKFIIYTVLGSHVTYVSYQQGKKWLSENWRRSAVFVPNLYVDRAILSPYLSLLVHQ